MATRNVSKVIINEPATETVPKMEPIEAIDEIETAPELQPRTYKVRRQLDQNMAIPVINGFSEKLVYESCKTGETFFGKILATSRIWSLGSFAIRLFLLIAYDLAVMNYLGVAQYYKNPLTPGDFDSLFTKTPAEIQAIIEEMRMDRSGR